MAKIEILQPRSKHDRDLPMPYTFMAVGTVNARVADTAVQSVEAILTPCLGGDCSTPGTDVDPVRVQYLSPNGRGRRQLHWFAFFKDVTLDPADPQPAQLVKKYRLTVTALDKDGNPVQDPRNANREVDARVTFFIRVMDRAATTGEARMEAALTYEFPPDDYTIEGGERDYFLPFGGSDLPVVSVTLGGKPADHVEWFGDPDFFWWAEFTGLATDPGPDTDYDLIVTDTQYEPALRTVHIADM